jgi:hypothetical protein
MAVLDTSQMLWEIEQIKQLKARYFRFLDTKQWDKLKELFIPDATWDVHGGSGHYQWSSRDAFIADVARAKAHSVTVHHGHMPEIELIDEANARGVWAMFDYVEEAGWPPRHGYGHYHETYTKGEAGWRIATFELTRLRVDALPAPLQRLS